MSDSGPSHPNPFNAPPPPLPPDEYGGRVTSGRAIASVILGLLSFVFWFFAAIPAIVLAAVAKSDIRRDPYRFKGNGLATLGLILGIIGMFLPIVTIPILSGISVGIISGGHGPTRGDRIVHLHLSQAIPEPAFDEAPALFSPAGYSFKGLIDRLDRARDDDSVKAVILTVEAPSMGFGQMEELWTALQALKDAGKPVYAHGIDVQTGMYAMLTGASHINVVPTDTVWLTGLRLQTFYLADALDKIGVQPEVLHMGAYKSAGEMFDRTGPSAPASENMNWLLDSLYATLVDQIAKGRGFEPDKVKELIDNGPYEAEAAKEAGLIDSVMDLDGFLNMIKQQYGGDIFIDNDYSGGPNGKRHGSFGSIANGKGEDTVGLIYITGAIMRGYEQVSPFGASGALAYSGNLRNTLKSAADDDNVKAIVLRVDSPGGSAVASDEILHAVELVKNAGKPVIVSMGSTAASGGYYASCKADTIFADDGTLTASIGVVGGKVNTAEMWDSLGIDWYAWQRGKNADIFDITKPWTPDQEAMIKSWMEDSYNVFKQNVVEGRGDKLAKPIDELAGGRVYTGQQALELGLVDKIGGLREAIVYAAEAAGIRTDQYKVRVLPERKGFWETFFAAFRGEQQRPSDLHFDHEETLAPANARLPFDGGEFAESAPLAAAAAAQLAPRQAAALQQAFFAATALSDEHVLTIMPQMVVVE